MSKPASPYLHDRLQARRANPTRSRRSDFGPRLQHLDDDIFMDEAKTQGCAPLASRPTSSRKDSDTTLARNLGAREMEKRMDTLSKLNFDLKMELFHCRERMEKLQKNCDVLASRADKAGKLTEENATLLELNDSLVKELEHRDEAVQEAVSMICDLEQKIERLQEPRQPPDLFTPPHAATAKPLTGAFSSPPESAATLSNATPSLKLPRRVPSFVGDRKPSTRALRSVYLGPTQTLRAVKSFASVVTQREDVGGGVSDADADALKDSPRLRVLSECSFPGIHDPVGRGTHALETVEERSLHLYGHQGNDSSEKGGSSAHSESDINSWVNVHTPQVSDHGSWYGQNRHIRSGNVPTSHPVSFTDQSRGKRASLSGSGFGEAVLPPTPESADTGVLQESYANFADTNESRNRKKPRALTLAKAKKHAALLHTPDTPAGINLNADSHARRCPTIKGWTARHSIELSSSGEESDFDDRRSVDRRPAGDAALEEDMYPTGGSIVTGTPSRFQVRHLVSPAVDMIFNGDGVEQVARPAVRRRNTSSEIHHHSNADRRDLDRSETSPNIAAWRTSTQTDSASKRFDHQRQPDLTPVKPGRSEGPENQRSPMNSASKDQVPASTGMRASISQKTHKLLRRMSDGRGDSLASKVLPTTTSAKNSSRLASPRRPNTASIVSGRRGVDDDRNASPNGLQRPDQEKGLMAVQAAHQETRRQSEGYPARGTTLSPGSSRGLYKKTGSGKR